MKTEMIPEFTNVKSFYKKAYIDRINDLKVLYSYDTKVAYIKNDKAVVLNTYSATTLKHIKEFLKQEGFKAETKKQIERDYYEN